MQDGFYLYDVEFLYDHRDSTVKDIMIIFLIWLYLHIVDPHHQKKVEPILDFVLLPSLITIEVKKSS